jgi:hypothetical protein
MVCVIETVFAFYKVETDFVYIAEFNESKQDQLDTRDGVLFRHLHLNMFRA